MCSVKLKSKKTCQVLIGWHNYRVLDRKEKLPRKGESSDIPESRRMLESMALTRRELCPLPCQETLQVKWVLLFNAPRFPSAPMIPINTEIDLHFVDKNFKVCWVHLCDTYWLHGMAEGTCQGDSSRCGTACFVPCFFLHSLARLAEATENYPEALLAWAACRSGDSKCFTPLENSLVSSLSSVLICLQSCSRFSPGFSALASASPHFLMLAFWRVGTS